MPISLRDDVAPEFGLDADRFGLRETDGYSGGSYLDHVKERIADRNYRRFHESWGIGIGSLVGDHKVTQRNIIRSLGANFGLGRKPELGDAFNDLWHLIWDAKQYKKEVDADIHDALEEAYAFAGRVAAGEVPPGSPVTWARIRDDRDHAKFVVFSDHHMTAFDDFSLANYFLDFNYDLYLAVLGHYAAAPDWCLVENGDVEECIIYETTPADARARKRARADMPIRQNSADWKPFLELRYERRRRNLDVIFERFSDYYDQVRHFIAEGRYVRLTGNHDTYSNTQREDTLLEMIEDQLGTSVHDILRIHRGDAISHVIMHGHQFDTVSVQHGSVPFALSLGEIFSEATSWIYQGPDRFWSRSDVGKWISDSPFSNVLAREAPKPYVHGGGQWDLLMENIGQIKDDPRGFVETLLDHEIAWEYFENDNEFYALALEVAPGEEMFKFRHLNERDLCEKYRTAFESRPGVSFAIPSLIIGHTHEVRQNALNPDTGQEAGHYLNSGSAGRFEGLIWCVEIDETGDRIVSWSSEDGRLKKITWRSDAGTLVHERVEWISAA